MIETIFRAVDRIESAIEKTEPASLRDQFAMSALNGLCGLNWATREIPEPTAKDHAEMAYKYADAMIEARKP